VRRRYDFSKARRNKHARRLKRRNPDRPGDARFRRAVLIAWRSTIQRVLDTRSTDYGRRKDTPTIEFVIFGKTGYFPDFMLKISRYRDSNFAGRFQVTAPLDSPKNRDYVIELNAATSLSNTAKTDYQDTAGIFNEYLGLPSEERNGAKGRQRVTAILQYMREVFFHEVTHMLDEVRFSLPEKEQHAASKSQAQWAKKYFNSPVELNAYYQAVAVDADYYCRKWFGDDAAGSAAEKRDAFSMVFGETAQNYVTAFLEAYRKHVGWSGWSVTTIKNRKRLIKRAAGLWEHLKAKLEAAIARRK
jgi:hypothetical protein